MHECPVIKSNYSKWVQLRHSCDYTFSYDDYAILFDDGPLFKQIIWNIFDSFEDSSYIEWIPEEVLLEILSDELFGNEILFRFDLLA
jgi:hypothetical protein